MLSTALLDQFSPNPCNGTTFSLRVFTLHTRYVHHGSTSLHRVTRFIKPPGRAGVASASTVCHCNTQYHFLRFFCTKPTASDRNFASISNRSYIRYLTIHRNFLRTLQLTLHHPSTLFPGTWSLEPGAKVHSAFYANTLVNFFASPPSLPPPLTLHRTLPQRGKSSISSRSSTANLGLIPR
jgi:hypothetical protein